MTYLFHQLNVYNINVLFHFRSDVWQHDPRVKGAELGYLPGGVAELQEISVEGVTAY
jgi:hypothetical protein